MMEEYVGSAEHQFGMKPSTNAELVLGAPSHPVPTDSMKKIPEPYAPQRGNPVNPVKKSVIAPKRTPNFRTLALPNFRTSQTFFPRQIRSTAS